jgi:hypothetical protein
MNSRTCTHGREIRPLCTRCPATRPRTITYRRRGVERTLGVTELKPEGAWISATTPRGRQPIHRVTRAWTLAGLGKNIRVGGSAVCGVVFATTGRLHVEPPEDLDFCDDCLIDNERMYVVYRFYDAAGRLLYIGNTWDLVWRISKHRKYSPFGPLITRTEWDEYPTSWLAEKAEAKAIRTMRPLYNVTHNTRVQLAA